MYKIFSIIINYYFIHKKGEIFVETNYATKDELNSVLSDMFIAYGNASDGLIEEISNSANETARMILKEALEMNFIDFNAFEEFVHRKVGEELARNKFTNAYNKMYAFNILILTLNDEDRPYN
jgi:hypothetical protein